MNALHVIQEDVERRVAETCAQHGNWPCRKGCDDCCRQLASVPQVTAPEWERIAAALEALPLAVADMVRARIREMPGSDRPIICPLLDLETGTCLVYQARPIACRTYGFYAERHEVLGCHRIAKISRESADTIWGNHAAVEQRLRSLGPATELNVWLEEAKKGRSHASKHF